MSLADLLAIFRRKPAIEKQLKKLLQQIDSAMEELKIKTAEAIADLAGLEQKLSLAVTTAKGNDEDHIAVLQAAIANEKLIIEDLKKVFADLKNRKADIELAIEQNLARQRKAAASELLTSVYKNFGSDLVLNRYLEKFSSESLKIELTAESNLKIELLRNGKGQY